MKPEYLDISPLLWVVEKLKKYGLFEEAEYEIEGDPMVDYTTIQNSSSLCGPGSMVLSKQPRPGVEAEQLRSQLFQLRKTHEMDSIDDTKVISNLTSTLAPTSTSTITSTNMGSDANTPTTFAKTPAVSTNYSLPPHKMQILVNEYSVRQNIGTHFDDALAFGPIVTGISLSEGSTLTLSMPHCFSEAENYIRLNRKDLENLSTNEHNREEKTDFAEVLWEPQDGLSVTLSRLTMGEIDIEDLMSRDHAEKCIIEENENYAHAVPRRGTSYDCSIRDFTQRQWTASSGPSILGKFCRCTRDAFQEAINSELTLPDLNDENTRVSSSTFTSSSTTTYSASNEGSLSSIKNDKEWKHLAPTLSDVNQCRYNAREVHVPIRPGSVYVLAGSARYKYRHGIRKLPRPAIRDLPDYRRVSLTVRSLLPGRRQVAQGGEEDRAKNLEMYKYYQREKAKSKQVVVEENSDETRV